MDRSPPRRNEQRRRRWRGRIGAIATSAAAHAAFIAAVLIGWRTPAPLVFQPAIAVSFAPPLPPPKPPAPRAALRKPAAHAAPKATAPKLAAAHPAHRHRDAAPPMAARRSPAPPTPESPPAAIVEAREAGDGDGLTDAQIAGAQAAGEGSGAGDGGGGECDMARRVQAALRKDQHARDAIHAAGGRALVIWNGDWVQHGGEDGKGLAAVREAITWEVAFAPAACRHQRVRGLILLSLADGSARLALGAGDWRWSDLLGLR